MDPSQKSRGCQVDNSQFNPASHLTGASARSSWSSLCGGQGECFPEAHVVALPWATSLGTQSPLGLTVLNPPAGLPVWGAHTSFPSAEAACSGQSRLTQLSQDSTPKLPQARSRPPVQLTS